MKRFTALLLFVLVAEIQGHAQGYLNDFSKPIEKITVPENLNKVSDLALIDQNRFGCRRRGKLKSQLYCALICN